MTKKVERASVESIKDQADLLLYGQWVPLPPDFLTVKEVKEVLRDFLDVAATVGATGRFLLSEDVDSPEIAKAGMVSLVKEAMRLYAGVLHYGLGEEIPDAVLRYLENQGDS